MKLVILDAYSVLQEDIALPEIDGVEVVYYERTPQDQVVERIGDGDAIFVSKCKITGEVLDACPNLKYVGEIATGYDNVDVEAAKARGVAVTNCPAYATDFVAQHTIALLLEIAGKIGAFNERVRSGEWQESKDFCLMSETMTALAGKSIGIVGYGNIGKKVAEIAVALGMTVNIYSKDRTAAIKSDVVSLHCPLSSETENLVNEEFISEMKDGAVLLNTSRGKLIDEDALAEALKSGKISAAGLDVLREEPPKKGSPLIGLPNCYITPHVAWMAKEIRQRIITISTNNLKSYLKGESLNRVV